MTAQQIVNLLPKQHDFLIASDREVLYSGSFAAGKTRALCYKLCTRASVPGAREGLCRKELVTLKATTLRTLLDGDGDLPPVLPRGTYEHNQSDKRIAIRGGGSIVYFGIDEPSKIGSYNLSGCAIDEAAELAERDYAMLRGRIRMPVEGLPNQLYMATNPDSPSHWLAQRFGLAGQSTTPISGCRAIQTCTADNRYLSRDYVADIATFTGVARARYYEGRWAGSDRLVYDAWTRDKFVTERHQKWSRIVVGVDEGYVNPCAVVVCGIDGDGRMHVVECYHERRKLQSEVVQHCVSVAKKYRPDAFVCDPSAAGLIADLRSKGLHCVEADNAVMQGIQAVRRRLIVAGDGRARLTVDPRCSALIAEFETYETVEGQDRPVKENDHALDALRYAVMYVDSVGPEARPYFV